MKKIVFLLMAFGFVFVTSCEKEDNTRPENKEVTSTVVSGIDRKKLPTHDGGE